MSGMAVFVKLSEVTAVALAFGLVNFPSHSCCEAA